MSLKLVSDHVSLSLEPFLSMRGSMISYVSEY